MSEYKQCRICGDDLGWDGRGFGWNECCCNRGYCTSCCMLRDKDKAEDDA